MAEIILDFFVSFIDQIRTIVRLAGWPVRSGTENFKVVDSVCYYVGRPDDGPDAGWIFHFQKESRLYSIEFSEFIYRRLAIWSLGYNFVQT